MFQNLRPMYFFILSLNIVMENFHRSKGNFKIFTVMEGIFTVAWLIFKFSTDQLFDMIFLTVVKSFL